MSSSAPASSAMSLRLGGLNNRHSSPTVQQCGTCKVKVLAGSVSGERPLPGHGRPPSHAVLTWPLLGVSSERELSHLLLFL